MTVEKKNSYTKKGVHLYVSEFIASLPELSGKTVLDIPCGDGRTSYEFLEKGADVKAFDLFPSFMTLKDIEAQYADLSEELPVEDSSVDYIVCQEGIEHVSNQLYVLQEFNRVLKKKGILLITTPNYSHLRARLSRFFFESSSWRKIPPTEIDSIWFAESESDKLYFGHLFLLGVHHFQSLLTITGFETEKRLKTNMGNTSLLLGVLLYPAIGLVSLLAWMLYRRKNRHVEQSTRDHVFWKRVVLNLSPKTLFCKHIFWVLRKDSERQEIIAKLKKLHRKDMP